MVPPPKPPRVSLSDWLRSIAPSPRGRWFALLASGVVTFVPAFSRGAEPLLTLDIATTPPSSGLLTRVYGHGSDGDGRRGVPVCGGFDCDGDGYRDYAFAQFLGDPLGRTDAGEVTFVFGDGGFGDSIIGGDFSSRVLKIAGDAEFETTGDEVWIDDIDGDGLGDIIIGRQNYSPDATRPGAGALTLIFGSAALKTHAATLSYFDLRSPPPGVTVVTFVGPGSYDRLGIWMRTGDISGDGIADIVVGADEVDDGASLVSNEGATFVIRGGPHLASAPAVVDLADFETSSFPEAMCGHVAWLDPPADANSNYHLGATVQVADLDGNGRCEVLTAAALSRSGAGVRLPGAPFGTGRASGGAQVGGSTVGSVFIIWDENFPPWKWPDGYRFRVDEPPVGDFTRIDGAPADRAFGEEMVGGLDYSGDGFPDLFIGDLAATPAAGRFAGGVGYVVYNAGDLRGLTFRISAPPAGTFVSTFLGPIAGAISSDTVLHGDFDGDGIDDLAIGNPHDAALGRDNSGSIHVFYGQPGTWPTFVDLIPDSLGGDSFPGPDVARVAFVAGANADDGANRGDTLCYSAAAGEINGDGRTDLLVNEMAGDDPSGSPFDVGHLLVIDGAALLDPLVFPFASPGQPIDFGSVAIGAPMGATEVFLLSNTGTETVTIDTVTIEGAAADDFSIAADSGETDLDPGESRSITLAYLPSVDRRFAGAALAVRSSAGDLPFRVGLRGLATDASTPPVEASTAVLEGGDAHIQTGSHPGFTYELLESPDLSTWSPLATEEGTGGLLYFSVPGIVPGSDRTFFQVTAEPYEAP